MVVGDSRNRSITMVLILAEIYLRLKKLRQTIAQLLPSA